MKRRQVVGALVPLSTAGCLRLTGATDENEAGTTESAGGNDGGNDGDGTGEATVSDVTATVELPDEFGVGTEEAVGISVENVGDGDFRGEVLLLLDREVQATTDVSIRSQTVAHVELEVALENFDERTLSVEIRTDETREVAFEETVVPTARRLALDWGTVYVPADDPDNSLEDERLLSYCCREMFVETSDETLASYDVGVEGAEPTFLEGAYGRSEDDRSTLRFFGTESRRTVIEFDDVDLAAASRVRLRGYIPPMEDDLGVEALVGQVETDRTVLDRELHEHTVSLSSDD